MKKTIINLLTTILLTNTNITSAQEWHNIKSYKKETGNPSLLEGCWLKKDRKRQTKIWDFSTS